MEKSKKRCHFNLDNDNDDKEYILTNDSHIDKFNFIKKKKIENQINDLSLTLDNFNINTENNQKINQFEINNFSINNFSKNNFSISNFLISEFEISNEIKNKNEKINKLKDLILFEKNFTYDSLIILVNNLVKKLGMDNVVFEKITDSQLQNIIWEYVKLILYPSFLFDLYLFDDTPNQNYIEKRIKVLDEICPRSKYLFPTWKKIYNYDINYNFDYNFGKRYSININICKNFTKKVFEFYEKVYGIYFNMVFGEILSYLLDNYQINLNPFDNKFNLNKFNEWVNGFNLVIVTSRIFIKNIANSIQIEKIDELNQFEITKLLNKINDDFIINFESNKQSFYQVFEPMKKFYNKTDKSFISSKCLDNINNEIISVFRLKKYITMLTKNK